MNAIHENERGIDVDNTEALKAIIAGNEIYHNFGLNSGIHLTHANAAIYGNYIHHDAGDGITIAGIGSPVIQKNILMDNQGFGVNHLGSAVPVDARYNYWNDAGGPGGAGPGSGDRVSSGVDYAGWRREAVISLRLPRARHRAAQDRQAGPGYALFSELVHDRRRGDLLRACGSRLGNPGCKQE